MQNHHNLLYREEEREMLPLLKVSWRHLHLLTSRSGHLSVQLEPSAPRRRMHPVESLGERPPHSAVGRDQRTRNSGFVSVQDHTEKSWSLTVSSWSGTYKGNNGSEGIVRRFVTLPRPLLLLASAYLLSASKRLLRRRASRWPKSRSLGVFSESQLQSSGQPNSKI